MGFCEVRSHRREPLRSGYENVQAVISIHAIEEFTSATMGEMKSDLDRRTGGCDRGKMNDGARVIAPAADWTRNVSREVVGRVHSEDFPAGVVLQPRGDGPGLRPRRAQLA